MKQEVLFDVRNLCKYFRQGRKKVLKAVDHVSFQVFAGETLGIVGESGCGKTTCGRTCIGLYRKTSGEVLYRGQDIHAMSKKDYREFTKEVQTVFQDPYASLNPRMRVEDIIAEGIDIHKMAKNREERRERVYRLLELVGLEKEHADRYIHEFSGGQRQRIGIARALAVDPSCLLCDESVSALDVSVQAQILKLLLRLQEEKKLTYLFITHDLSVVRFISDRLMVMYLGRVMEIGGTDELCGNPVHPYTKILLSSVPIPDPDKEKERMQITLKGELPNPLSPPAGCVFSPRCPYATETCRTEEPELREVSKGHFAACHYIK